MTEATEQELFDFAARVRTAPEAPGVYIMRDREGRIVYVGKSVNLRSRLRAYANQTDARTFVRHLPLLLGEIETIIAPSEKDALQLECELINEHRPRFNVSIPGEGSWAWLRVDEGHEVPRVEIVRESPPDGARYFGPYRSAFAVRRLKDVLDRHFMLRTCGDAELRNRARPCLQYQIKRCSAPCVFDLSEIRYAEHVHDAVDFLAGRREVLKQRLVGRMLDAAEELEFEVAAHFRDQIAALELAEVRREAPVGALDVDVFGHYREGEAIVLQVMFVRRGRLKGSRHFTFEEQPFPEAEIYSSFLNLYYSGGATIPDEIVVPVALEDASALEALLSELRAAHVSVVLPDEGQRGALARTAAQNAEQSFKDAAASTDFRASTLARLQERLKLVNLPQRIECFDISNLQGHPIVGSMVVFEGGEPAPRAYRTYRVKTVQGQDDFASMYEVLTRRLKRTLTGELPRPDLLVIDGGKGQLAQAVQVMADLQITGIDVVALAKSRDVSGDEAEVAERTPERVFFPGRKNPLVLKQNSAELFLLQRLRDEAHRVAITYHRKLRRKQTLKSRLADIPGVGPGRQRALLQHFGGLAKIRQATVDELCAVSSVHRKLAEEIVAFFQAERDAAEL